MILFQIHALIILGAITVETDFFRGKPKNFLSSIIQKSSKETHFLINCSFLLVFLRIVSHIPQFADATNSPTGEVSYQHGYVYQFVLIDIYH
jgi:hypothetical protein